MIKLTLFILILLFASELYSRDIYGTVIAVADGDTVTVLDESKSQYKIRLSDIDSPEKNQAYGQSSKQFISEIIFSKEVKVTITGQDRYSRYLGTIYLDDINVNAEMISNGFAWVYRKYSDNQKLIQLESIAQKKKLGLWSDTDPIPPWDFRRGMRRYTHDRVVNGNCGTKRYCKEMNSCEEAYHYLRNCGLNRLDGDRDGVPCERICI